jgi:hypothetical protein
MGIEPVIGFTNQFAVKTLFAAAGLVTGDEQNCPALWIECESNPPNTVGSVKAHLFHIGVARILECVDTWPSQLRTELLQPKADGEGFVLNLKRQR